MKELNVAPEAQQALVRLLIKLNLIEEKANGKNFVDGGLCPIAHYAAQGSFDEQDALRLVGERLELEAVSINKEQIPGLLKLLDHSSVAAIGLERWRAIRALPFAIEERQLTLAMANPLDHSAKKALKFDLDLDVREVLASENAILDVLTRKRDGTDILDLETLLKKSEEAQTQQSENTEAEPQVGEHDLSAAPVVRLVNNVFSSAVQAGASDIHLNPEKDGLMVKARVDGLLQPLFSVPLIYRNGVVSRLKLLSGMDIAERRRPQDGRLRIKTVHGTKDLRLSTIPTIYGESVAIRILASDLSRLNFTELGMPAQLQKTLERALTGNSRVILVTGPTGSGKTSTLYAALLQLRDGTSNLVTIEDPIEYRIQGVNQIQVNAKTGLTFANGLRSVLRQDPDVIMVGEIRDYDTCSTALQAAQTGHMVLSTLHTNTAAGAVTRMRDLGIPSFVIASALGGVLAQRLIRKLCPHCCVPLERFDAAAYGGLGLKPAKLRQAKGCSECNHTGYKGRTGIYSFLNVTDSVREAIRLDTGEQDLEFRARENGFQSLIEGAVELLNNGFTSLAEVEQTLGSLEGQVLTVPFVNKLPSQSDAGLKSAGQATPNQPLDKRRVLVVEDDENTRLVLSMLLQREMFEVDVAGDGMEGLEKTYKNLPHLILCDLMMPRMNGLEMIRKLRHDQRVRAIPVLMLTAADSESNEVEVIESGADDFVSKTADSKVMLSRIHRLLDRSGL